MQNTQEGSFRALSFVGEGRMRLRQPTINHVVLVKKYGIKLVLGGIIRTAPQSELAPGRHFFSLGGWY